ncbi:MAG TPA: hypothetical protein VM536_22355 [Chloroflexia bacterium]|nr:hypothetical protein [Chloroflexia bacterium]
METIDGLMARAIDAFYPLLDRRLALIQARAAGAGYGLVSMVAGP